MATAAKIRCLICNTENDAAATACAICGAPLSADPASAFSNELSPGTTLHGGLYSIGKVLGQGGFGITYLGADLRARRPVAIKEFFPYGSTRRGATVHPFGGLSSKDFAAARQKFLEEARVLSRFDDPGIVDVYGTFEENGTAYMVMEFLRGRSLGKLVEERGALPEREAVGYIERVGEALRVVHAANMLHRDLKPNNIMLTDTGQVVLIDFGNARTFAAGKTGRMTTMVTPGYAPLEQYGEHVRFGPFTDVYALGATLYHLLTGRMPMSATDRASGATLEPPRALNPAVSEAVSDAVMWAMKMRVDERPQSAGAFLSALGAARARPVSASPEPEPTPVAGPPTPAAPRPPTWKPPLPYDGPYDVEVSSETLRWPNRCACCTETADSSLLVEYTAAGGFLSMFEESRAWDVPYCSPCVQHVGMQAPSAGNALGGAVAGALLGGPVGLLIGLGAAAASVYGAAKYSSELEGLLKPTCAAVGPAVAYRGWYRDTHEFTFLNREYAREFARENGGRIGP